VTEGQPVSTRQESYLAGLIGDGVLPSLTPPIHEREAEHHGLRCVYRPVDLHVLGLGADAVGPLLRAGRDLGFNGFNITHPCKQVVIAELDEVVPDAARLGAVNTVVVAEDGRLVGHNTDATGFAWGFTRALPDVAREHVVQIGTGGAGSAVAHALLRSGVRHLHLVDLDVARAAALAALLTTAQGGEPGDEHADEHAPTVTAHGPADVPDLIVGADGLVNCTPVGMHQHPGTPLDLALLHPRLWVADVIYRPMRTQLVEAADALGCRVMEGGWMAVGQAVDAFTILTGRQADEQRMRDHFRELVEAGR